MLHDGQMVDWPAQFQMTPVDSSSGLWTNLSVTVNPVQRNWVQEKIDWAVIALEKMVE